MTEEVQDVLQPAHEGVEEAVVVQVDLVDEFVEAVLVAGAEVDEGLDSLVGVCGNVLALRALDNSDGVIGELGEVGYAAVNVCRLVDTDEGFVEDCEQVAEELEGDGLWVVSIACLFGGWPQEQLFI